MAGGRRARYAAAAGVAVVTLLTFAPLFGFPFLNWDDQDVFVRNQALRAPDVASWAATTRFMEHYQPLAWMTWATVERAVGLTAAAAHALNVVLHALCAAAVFLLVRRLVARGPAEAGLHAGLAESGGHRGPAKAGHHDRQNPAKAGHNDARAEIHDVADDSGAIAAGALAALVLSLIHI